VLRLEYLASLADQYRDLLNLSVQDFDLAGVPFRFSQRPHLMGVINLSSDSWYRESVVLTEEAAVQRAEILAAQGADLVDIGAESTLLKARRVSGAEQIHQLVPLVKELRSRKLVVSVETYQIEVARECLKAGANVLNLTGTDPSREILQEVARHDAGVILCYVQGENVREVRDFDLSEDPIPQMYEFFARQVERATEAGVRRIFIDPGLGFYYRNLEDGALRVRHQMTVFLNAFRLRRLGWPICNALPHAFEYFRDEVRSAEPFFAVLAALGRTDVFRTHEIPKVRAVLETLSAY
jgi:dihydropteroate synthase